MRYLRSADILFPSWENPSFLATGQRGSTCIIRLYTEPRLMAASIILQYTFALKIMTSLACSLSCVALLLESIFIGSLSSWKYRAVPGTIPRTVPNGQRRVWRHVHRVLLRCDAIFYASLQVVAGSQTPAFQFGHHLWRLWSSSELVKGYSLSRTCCGQLVFPYDSAGTLLASCWLLGLVLQVMNHI